MEKLNNLKLTSQNAHKLMKEDYSSSAEKRWLEKEVTNKTILYNGSSLENLSFKETLKCSISDKETLNNPTSFLMEGMTYAEGISPRPTLTVSLKSNNLDLSNYNRLSFIIKANAIGYQNFYVHFSILNDQKWTTHAPIIVPNKWEHVIWEIGGLERNNIKEIQVSVFMMGCPPEGLPNVEIYLNEISAEVVANDYDNGWDLEDRIAFSHVGYLPKSEKIALIGKTINKQFTIYTKDNEIAYNGVAEEINTPLGSFNKMDFSSLEEQGEYYLTIDDKKSLPFTINKKAFDSSIWKSMNFLRALRCGVDIEGIHSACHLNCRSFHSDGSSVPNFGGWHDAGDVSQFEICTGEMAHAILDLAENIKDKDNDLYVRLLEEARVGINWLLQTKFKDGYRALAVLYNVWRSNLLDKDNTSVYKNSSDNGPFENFISAAALAKASFMFKDDEIFSSWCKREAIDDFYHAKEGYKNGVFTKRWGRSVDSQVCGHGILAAVEIYNITKDLSYLEIAKEYAKIVLSCQETNGFGKDKIRGFFYEDPSHTYTLTYEHRGHEQSPIHGITKLMQVLPNDPEYSIWLNGINLYKEYILKTIDASKPYSLLPAHIYQLDKINLIRYSSYGMDKDIALNGLKEQIKNGQKIDENTYLRIMPISVQRRGFHATLLSKTKAVSAIAKVLNDQTLKQIAIDQIEWIFGKNPFASSTMVSEGYNYHPLYVAFSPQIVGSLPVGIKTKGSEDTPYWPQSTEAVYKEIWGHTTGKYLWILADIY